MSEPVRVALMLAGWFVFMIPLLVWELRRAPQHVNQELAKMVGPLTIDLDENGDEWLRRQLVRRQHWSTVGINVMLLIAVIALIYLPDNERAVIAWSAMQCPVAIVFGHSVGAALAFRRQVATGNRRVANLRPRALQTYTRWWERVLLRLHVGAAASTAVAAVSVSIVGTVEPGITLFLLLLSSGWLGVLALVRLFRHRAMRTPPPIDNEDRGPARELLISIAVRDLLRIELLAFMVVAMSVMFYLPTVIDGFMPTLAVLPLYVLAGGIALTRHIRRERGHPAPEWHFARVPGSTA